LLRTTVNLPNDVVSCSICACRKRNRSTRQPPQLGHVWGVTPAAAAGDAATDSSSSRCFQK